MSDPPVTSPLDVEAEPITSRSGDPPAIPDGSGTLSLPPVAPPPLETLAPISAMPIIDLGGRNARTNNSVEVDGTGVHRSSMPPRPIPRPPAPGSLRPAAAGLADPTPARAPADSDVDEEGYLRSDALHTLLDPSELNGARDAARFALTRERAPEPDEGPEIPVDIGSDIDAARPNPATANPAKAPVPADEAARPEQPDDDHHEMLEAHDTIDVEIDSGSEPKTAVAAPAQPAVEQPAKPAVTVLTDPESHTFATPENRSSELPTEVDPEDMEIEEVAGPPHAGSGAGVAPRTSGAELAAAVQAQNANETPAFKRTRYWWDELFGDDFLRTMDKLTDAQVRKEVNFIEESLAVQKSGIVLDLACGSGRHAVEMASRGYNVVGYDLSVAMLARAADEAQERKQKLNFLHGDMRDMGFEEMFDGIYCWSTSFGYFDDEKNLMVAQNIHRALRKGGMFLLDLANRDFVAQRQPSLVWFEGEGCVCMDEMRIDFITSRLKVKRMVMLDDGRSRELDYSIRLYTLHELGRMLHEVGFKVTEVSGQPATPGVFMGGDSPRIIVLAEKA